MDNITSMHTHALLLRCSCSNKSFYINHLHQSKISYYPRFSDWHYLLRRVVKANQYSSPFYAVFLDLTEPHCSDKSWRTNTINHRRALLRYVLLLAAAIVQYCTVRCYLLPASSSLHILSSSSSSSSSFRKYWFASKARYST